MWLTSFLNKDGKDTSARRGSVSGADSKSVNVDASTQHRGVDVVAPFGIAYVPPLGEGAVVVPFDGGEACVGVLSKAPAKLQRGELMLYSKGGASIILKNDGSVLINGKQVSP
ncbi:MAG: phage baseplate assembly protein [Clostridia bacterium]|nr:phage baseplate assembly protein [Clostridia bacterium]